jgi:hypothetical protein
MEGLQPHVRCPYCQHDQGIDPRRLSELAAYEQSAGAVLQRIEGEREGKAQFQALVGSGRKSQSPWVGVLFIPMVLVVWGVGVGLEQANIVSIGFLRPGSFLVVFFVGIVALVVIRHTSVTRGTHAPLQVGAQCSRCGAPRMFEAGKSIEQCAHCGASLLAGPTVQRQVMEAAQVELRHEALSRLRNQRSVVSSMPAVNDASLMFCILFGSAFPMSAALSVAFTLERVRSDRPETTLAQLAALYVFAFLNLAIPAAVLLSKRNRKARWREVADGFARSLAGRVTTSRAEWVGWLNALWAGDYPLAQLATGRYFHAAMGRIGAFPIALDLDPVPAANLRPRADVLLAACLPADAMCAPVPADLAARAQAQGLVLSVSCAGFQASGGSLVEPWKAGHPGVAANALLAAAGLVAEWAARSGASAPTM